MTELTQQRLKEIIHYDPDTGIFTQITARRRWGSIAAGTRLGVKAYRKKVIPLYIRLNIDGIPYLAHRVAVLYMTGRWPILPFVDHIDTDPFNNRWLNLREATHSQNCANRGATREGALKWAYAAPNGKWKSIIAVGKKQKYLGTFNTANEAHLAAFEIAKDIHGQFARASK